MDWLVQAAGLAMVLLALIDIYFTVLYPRSHVGLLSAPLSRGMWQLFRLTVFAYPTQRDRLLPYNGPTLLVAIVVVWVSLLISGFALICWPALGSEIQASQGPTPTDFATALYYSGYALTTLGTGDILPKTGFYRLLMILETVVGLSSLTLTVTYLQSVYSALIRRNTFALSLQYRTVNTADAAELIARLGAADNFDGARQDIADMAKDLLNLLETDHSYPVLHYFRYAEAYYALPRMIFVAMDMVSLIKSALNTQKYSSLIRSAAVAELWGGGLQLLVELSASFLPKKYRGGKGQSEQAWRERYYAAVEQLKHAGIETTLDLEAGAELYLALRRKWGPYIIRLTEYLAYDWSEVAPRERPWHQDYLSRTKKR
ncbi:MAG TPA: ion channel [Candidatus Caenarcaniphilales bacterium]